MALSPGTYLGPYEILSALGAGGMGEVYRGRDTKLNRMVALKILPEAFTRDPDRLGRFRREAHVLASLNHPNIGAIYGFEESNGVQALVLELVEGPTLADRIGQGPIPVDEALRIARQMGEALEAAHDQGVVHRDLKPANVKITPDEKVKVLDFGLAKAMETTPAGANLTQSPTLSMATQAGVILGTAAYMSPEQAKGFAADQRSDLFSFGVVLYEMLTGRQPFKGETVADVLASVLAREPDLSALPPSLNPRLPEMVRRCLEKNPKRRWQAVGDLRMEIESVLADPQGVEIKAAALARSPARWKLAAAVLASAVIGAAIAGPVRDLWRSPAAARVARFSFVLPDDQTFTGPGRQSVAVSPDGASVVYVADDQLYLRPMAEAEARPIPGTNVDARSPAFSPDGRWITFVSLQDLTLKKIAVTGGAPLTLCEALNPIGVSWDDNTIVFSQGSEGILAVSATGGEPDMWVKAAPDEMAHSPQILPGGRSVLFTVTKGTSSDRWDKSEIVVQSRESSERKILIEGGSAGRYVPTGHIVYALGANLLAVPFDVQRLQVTGGPVPVVENVLRSGGLAHFGFSQDGTLVYVPNSISAQRVLALVDRSGKSNVLGLAPGTYDFPRLSHDGTRLAVQTADGGGTIWIYSLSARSSFRRLTFEGDANSYPTWSPDDQRIAFRSDRDGKVGIFWQAADGTGVAERLTTAPVGQAHRPDSWSPDGKTMALSVSKFGDGGISTLALTGERKIEPFIDVPKSNQLDSAFSPDGRWIAYASNESGRDQVYVQPFPSTGAKYQISREVSVAPVWSPDGSELFYYQASARKLAAVRIQMRPSFSFGDPVFLPIDGIFQGQAPPRYAITPDGKQFLVLLPELSGGGQSRPQVNVVLNWTEELKRLVPTR